MACSYPTPGRRRSVASAWPKLAGVGKHDTRSLIAMQYDQTTTFAAKLKKMFEAPGMAKPLKQAIEALPEADRGKAREAHTRLMAFDGKLSPTSADAAIYELFLQQSTQQIFLDELGPESSPAWKSLLLPTVNCPTRPRPITCWGVRTVRSGMTLARCRKKINQRSSPAVWRQRSAQATVSWAADHKAWQWGKLHRYEWKNASGQTVRGPLAAGGDHTTLNTAAFAWGQDFNHHPGASHAFYRRLRPGGTADGAERYGAIR